MTITQNEHGYYEARIKDKDGSFRSFSTHLKNRKEAEAFVKAAKLRELEEAAELGILTQNVISVLVGGKRMIVDEAVEPWIEAMANNYKSPNYVKNSETWVRAWIDARRLSRRQIIGITEDDIRPWINPEAGDMITAGTKRVMLSAVRSFISFASHKGWIMGNPAMLVSVDLGSLTHTQKEPRVKLCFTDAEVEILIRWTEQGGFAEDPFWRAAVPLSRCLGLRLGDICSLEWSCMGQDGSLTVWTKKRDKRVKPFVLHPEWLQGALASVERQDSDYFFPDQHAIITDPGTRSVLSTQFSRLCERVGITGKSFHDLRASYVTERAGAGVSLEEIAVDVGHSNTETTQGYVRPPSA